MNIYGAVYFKLLKFLRLSALVSLSLSGTDNPNVFNGLLFPAVSSRIASSFVFVFSICNDLYWAEFQSF